MFLLRKRYALMDEAAGAGGGGAPAGGDGGAAPAATPSASAPAAAPAAAAPSALASAGAAPAEGAPTTDFIPEKYRVLKEDGSFDMDASARKLAEAHGSLEKRLGTGEVPPKASTDYTVTVPDALKESMGELSNDKLFTQFRDDMHGLGLTQKQFDGVMQRYFTLAPQLAAGGQQFSAEQTTAKLRETWKDDGEYKRNIGLSYNATNSIAKAAGLTYDAVDAELGNNPTFIRLMAAIGPEFSEDSLPNEAKAAGFASDDEIKQLMLSDANTNPKNPQHKATRARIDAYYARKHGTAPVV